MEYAQAGVPKAEQVHRTKLKIAQEMVRHARAQGVGFAWVGDAGYGKSLAFLEALEADGEVFMADLHSNRHIYLADPAPYVPEQHEGPGRKRSRYMSAVEPIEVRQWAKQQPASAWRRETLRDATKGELTVEVLHARVWLWDKKSPQAHEWHLVVRREITSPQTLKYSASNAPLETSINALAKMQGQRYFIERAFEDAKSCIGMAQYQARKWAAWHRHMALVMMAMHFMLQTRLEQQEAYPLLSCYDIQILLATTLPDRRYDDPQELLRQMQLRHQKRQAAIDSAHRLNSS